MHLNLIGSSNPNKVCLILGLPGQGQSMQDWGPPLPQLWGEVFLPSDSGVSRGPGSQEAGPPQGHT